MNKVTLDDLKRFGLRPGRAFEELVSDSAARSAFENCTSLKLAFEFPLLVDGADPCFVTFAHVGDGTEYGFYIYPPMNDLTCDAVVQWDHDGPSIEFEGIEFGEWLTGQLKDADEGEAKTLLSKLCARHSTGTTGKPVPKAHSKLGRVLPTSKALAKNGSIRRFLEQPPPKKDAALVEYERQWNRRRLQSVLADGVGDADTTLLLAFGIETYRRLGWRLPYEALKQEDLELNLRAEEERPKNEALLWATVHPPSAKTIAQSTSDALKGAAFAECVLGEWIRASSFDCSLSDGAADQNRKLLGEHLSDALSRATRKVERAKIAGWLVDLGWAQAADLAGKLGLADASAKLRVAAQMQELGRQHAVEANDWSDVKG